MTVEEWKPVSFLNGKYDVSSLGRIRNAFTKETRRTPTSKRGYPVFSAYMNGKHLLVNVHKCVATEFCEKISEHQTQVNHIDGNKLNNSADNLEWCTPEENLLHARKTGLHESDGDKPVVQLKSGIEVARFKSASEAGRQTGIDRSSICNVCNKYVWNGHHCLTAGGYEWRWA